MRLQRTIKHAVAFEGIGIHNGEDVTLAVKGAPADTGINFTRIDLEGRPAVKADASNLADYYAGLRCTSIDRNGISICTIEHLMAALAGLSIDNAEVEINNSELPALDGSALDYTRELKRAEILEQDKVKKELVLKDAVWCAGGESLLVAVPHGNFRVSYLLEYSDEEVAAQYVDFSFNGAAEKEKLFAEEIAPARTFCLEREVAGILAKGLGKGADYRNALVISGNGPIENELRLKDEPARHKMMDLLGDLSLLNAEIKGHIVGIRSGHSLNAEFLRRLRPLL